MALPHLIERLDRLYENVWLDIRHRDLFLAQVEMAWPDLSAALRAYADHVKHPPPALAWAIAMGASVA